MTDAAATSPGAASRPIRVQIGDVSVEARYGQRLIDVCDANVTPLQFACRAGSCGTCMMRVIEGMQNLTAVTETERILLPELTDDPSARLACQVRILGPIRVVPQPPFAV